MESPDEYLGRLNFLGTRGFSESRGAPLQRGMGGARCARLCVCESACVCVRVRQGRTSGGCPPSSVPIDFTSVSLYSNFISVASVGL